MTEKSKAPPPAANPATPVPPPPAVTPTSFDFDSVQHVSSNDVARSGGRGGGGSVLGINVVYSEKNGRRVKFTDSLHDALDSPTQVQIATKGSQLVVAEKLPNATQTFKFSKGSGNTIIYSASLAKLLIEKFNLDFTNGRVSRSYHDVRIETQKVNGTDLTFAIINMVD